MRKKLFRLGYSSRNSMKNKIRFFLGTFEAIYNPQEKSKISNLNLKRWRTFMERRQKLPLPFSSLSFNLKEKFNILKVFFCEKKFEIIFKIFFLK